MAKQQKQLRVSGQKVAQPTRIEMEHAAEDARNITATDKIVQTCVAIDIISRRLYMIARETMAAEIAGGWDVQNPELVIQTLVMSAQEKANEKFPYAGLQQDVLTTVLPFLDILMAAAKAKEADDTANAAAAAKKAEENGEGSSSPDVPATVLPGSVDGGAPGVGAVLLRTDGDPSGEAGIGSEGSAEEAGGPG